MLIILNLNVFVLQPFILTLWNRSADFQLIMENSSLCYRPKSIRSDKIPAQMESVNFEVIYYVRENLCLKICIIMYRRRQISNLLGVKFQLRLPMALPPNTLIELLRLSIFLHPSYTVTLSRSLFSRLAAERKGTLLVIRITQRRCINFISLLSFFPDSFARTYRAVPTPYPSLSTFHFRGTLLIK